MEKLRAALVRFLLPGVIIFFGLIVPARAGDPYGPGHDAVYERVMADTIPDRDLVFITLSRGDRFPQQPLHRTSDFEEILLPEQEDSLNSLIGQLEKETGVQVAVVTLKSSWVSREYLDTLVLAIHNKWGVGVKGKNNGIVIGFSAGLRRIRISNGEGIVPYLSDQVTKAIIDAVILPRFREGAYFQGLLDGLNAIQRKLR